MFSCTIAQLAAERCLVTRLEPDPFGRPREAIVLLDEDDAPHAYLNQCRHLPIPLDSGSRQFIIGGDLMCATHGARYRLRDGFCISGPCRGASLMSMPIELSGGMIFVVDDGSVR